MLNNWLALCKREWKRMLRDPRIMFIFAGGPFFYAIIFGCVYWQGQTRHVPIVIADQDHSALSRQITQALRAADDIQIVGSVNSPDDLLPMIRREQAYACVEFPSGFERDVLSRRSPRVAMILDGSNTLIAATASSGIRTVLATYQVGLTQRQLEVELPSSVALNTANPLQQVTRPLFNPTGNYSYFILMGLVCVALQSVTRIGAGIALELDDMTQFNQSFPGREISIRTIFLSKLFATAAMALPIAYLSLSLPFILFGAPFRGNLLLFAVALTFFVFLQIGAAYGYSALCKSTVFCTQLHLFMSVIVFTLSGFTWPYYAMPAWIRGIATLMPLFHMNCLLRKSALVGAPVYTLWPHMAALVAMCALALAWGYWAVRSSMARTKA